MQLVRALDQKPILCIYCYHVSAILGSSTWTSTDVVVASIPLLSALASTTNVVSLMCHCSCRLLGAYFISFAIIVATGQGKSCNYLIKIIKKLIKATRELQQTSFRGGAYAALAGYSRDYVHYTMFCNVAMNMITCNEHDHLLRHNYLLRRLT